MASYSLVDTHAHLEEVAELDAALARAREAGVGAIIAVGSDLASCRRILAISQSHPGFVWPALGLHPGNLGGGEDVETAFRFLEENLAGAVAVGEIGLDYKVCRGNSQAKELQKHVLRRCLDLAGGKPVLLHSRQAWADVLDMVREVGVEKAVFHWYSGPKEVLKEIVEAGYYISATPAAQYSQGHQAAIRYVPLANLLLETDCPVMYRGRASEPADVLTVLKEVARLKGLAEELVASATTANAQKLFHI